MKHKYFKPFLILAVLLVAGLTFQVVTSDSVSGEEDKGAESAWNVRCSKGVSPDSPKKGSCEAVQKLVVKDTGQRLLEFAIGYAPDQKDPKGIMLLPLGILLEPGVTMKVDDAAPFKFSPRYCDAGGCAAFLTLNDKILNMFKKGDKAVIAFKAANGSEVNVELSLSGFAKAFKKVS